MHLFWSQRFNRTSLSLPSARVEETQPQLIKRLSGLQTEYGSMNYWDKVREWLFAGKHSMKIRATAPDKSSVGRGLLQRETQQKQSLERPRFKELKVSKERQMIKEQMVLREGQRSNEQKVSEEMQVFNEQMMLREGQRFNEQKVSEERQVFNEQMISRDGQKFNEQKFSEERQMINEQMMLPEGQIFYEQNISVEGLNFQPRTSLERQTFNAKMISERQMLYERRKTTEKQRFNKHKVSAKRLGFNERSVRHQKKYESFAHENYMNRGISSTNRPKICNQYSGLNKTNTLETHSCRKLTDFPNIPNKVEVEHRKEYISKHKRPGLFRQTTSQTLPGILPRRRTVCYSDSWGVLKVQTDRCPVCRYTVVDHTNGESR